MDVHPLQVAASPKAEKSFVLAVFSVLLVKLSLSRVLLECGEMEEIEFYTTEFLKYHHITSSADGNIA